MGCAKPCGVLSSCAIRGDSTPATSKRRCARSCRGDPLWSPQHGSSAVWGRQGRPPLQEDSAKLGKLRLSSIMDNREKSQNLAAATMRACVLCDVAHME